jgi:hypothetical protein
MTLTPPHEKQGTRDKGKKGKGRARMRLKMVQVSAELIEKFLTKGNETAPARVIEGLPEGAKLVAVGCNPNPYTVMKSVRPHTVELTFTHESFPEVEVGVAPELAAVTFQRYTER